MNDEIKNLLDELRDNKDFTSLKEVRVYLQQLININNKDWFDD